MKQIFLSVFLIIMLFGCSQAEDYIDQVKMMVISVRYDESSKETIVVFDIQNDSDVPLRADILFLVYDATPRVVGALRQTRYILIGKTTNWGIRIKTAAVGITAKIQIDDVYERYGY